MLLRRSAVALAGSFVVAVPGGVLAQTPDHPADTAAQFPTRNDLKSLTEPGYAPPTFVSQTDAYARVQQLLDEAVSALPESGRDD